jgi:methylphosphotriester-DNA--protein-cysteine methyltransferase
MRKKAALVLLWTMLTTTAFAADSPKLVASNYSDRYHRADCKIAQKIHKDELIEFKTPEEAIAAGLVPCKKCNPPTTSHPSD